MLMSTPGHAVSKVCWGIISKHSKPSQDIWSPERSFTTEPNLSVDVFGVPSQKCHCLSLVHCNVTHTSLCPPVWSTLIFLPRSASVKHSEDRSWGRVGPHSGPNENPRAPLFPLQYPSHRLIYKNTYTVPLCRPGAFRTNVQILHNNWTRVGGCRTFGDERSHHFFWGWSTVTQLLKATEAFRRLLKE